MSTDIPTFTSPAPIVLRHEANTKGRDLVLGDLHGCYEQLMRTLDDANFDPSADRVFSVGDLVDRGPDSFKCLKLIKSPWFHAVRGNHDDMLLSAIQRYDSIYHSSADFFYNGGKWLFDLNERHDDELRVELAPILEGLPYMRLIDAAPGQQPFNLVHAELMRPPGEYEDIAEGSDSLLFTQQELIQISKGQLPFSDTREEYHDPATTIKRIQAACTWGRRVVRGLSHYPETGPRQVMDFDVTGNPTRADQLTLGENPYSDGLPVTFVGHTIVKSMGLSQSHFFMDRGAYKDRLNYRMAMIDAQATLAWLERNVPREQHLARSRPNRGDKP